MMEKRVTYVSRYAKPLAEGELTELGEQAAEKNRELGVTGVLMASGGVFYQVLEGPSAAVDDLYKTIVEDDRHTDLLLLSSHDGISRRMFQDWAMKFVDLDAASHVRLLALKALIKSTFEQQRLVNNMTWAIERSIQYELREQGQR